MGGGEGGADRVLRTGMLGDRLYSAYVSVEGLVPPMEVVKRES